MKSQQSCKQLELPLGKCLGENISCIVVRWYVVQFDLGVFDSLTNEMVPKVNMFRSRMEFIILH
jgi:hypothetical protein